MEVTTNGERTDLDYEMIVTSSSNYSVVYSLTRLDEGYKVEESVNWFKFSQLLKYAADV